MNEHNQWEDECDEAWFDTLDALIEGEEAPSLKDDELLQVAAKLSDALAPLNAFATTSERSQQFTRVHSQALQNGSAPLAQGPKRRLLLRGLFAVAAALFVLFGVSGACATSPRVSAATLNAGRQIWQAATSFEQIDASSVALLSLKNVGVRPLLPVELPAGTESVEFGLITDSTDVHAFIAFIADYRVMGQDVSVYERPGDLVYSSSAAQVVDLGFMKGQLYQDDTGNSILQWYQDGMTCQTASTLPANDLIKIARQFKPITSWELIL